MTKSKQARQNITENSPGSSRCELENNRIQASTRLHMLSKTIRIQIRAIKTLNSQTQQAIYTSDPKPIISEGKTIFSFSLIDLDTEDAFTN